MPNSKSLFDISLRAPEPSDVDALYRLENLPEIWSVSWGEAPVSRQMIWEYVSSYSADIFRDRQLRFVIECDGNVAGTIDISDFNPSHSRAMIGIAITPELRRKGLAYNALLKAESYCKEGLNLHQLAALIPRSNEASMALFTKLGFKTAGCLRSWLRRGGEYEDVIILQKML